MMLTAGELPDADNLEFMFDALIEHITDVMAGGERHEEVRKHLSKWLVQLQLLNALYETTDEATLNALRTSLGGNNA
jgi:hypothetical protein